MENAPLNWMCLYHDQVIWLNKTCFDFNPLNVLRVDTPLLAHIADKLTFDELFPSVIYLLFDQSCHIFR